MKKFLIFILLCLASCKATPSVIPDKTPDNVIIQAYKDKINEPGPVEDSYTWLFWWAPITLLTAFWGYRELIKKPIPKPCIDSDGQIVESTKEPKKKRAK